VKTVLISRFPSTIKVSLDITMPKIAPNKAKIFAFLLSKGTSLI